jgi:hypothetical protein
MGKKRPHSERKLLVLKEAEMRQLFLYAAGICSTSRGSGQAAWPLAKSSSSYLKQI